VALVCRHALDAVLLEATLTGHRFTVTGVDVGGLEGPPGSDADVVVVDAGLPAGTAARAAAAAKRAPGPAPRVVVLCGDLDDAEIRDLVEAGADGFVRVDEGVDAAVTTLETVLRGQPAIPPAMLGSLLRGLIERRRDEDVAIDRYTRLSAKERAVVALLAEGADHEAIADRLVLSPHTARTHIQNVLRKLDVHSRLEAIALVERYDLLQRFPPEPA
jgi:DNA-binding NarL/FixJ family response regulator